MKRALELFKNHVAIAFMAVAAAYFMTPLEVFAQQDPDLNVGPLVPSEVFLFNNNSELSANNQIIVAQINYFLGVPHRLTIDFSSVGAIEALSASNPALLYIGCFVGPTPCIGSQANPPGVPAGWVNALSCDFSLTGPCA